MGSIRPTYVKRVAIDLIEQYPEEFGKDFEKNKENVSRLSDVDSTHLRNRIAGYITSYMNVSREL